MCNYLLLKMFELRKCIHLLNILAVFLNLNSFPIEEIKTR